MSLKIKKKFEEDTGVWKMELDGEIDIYTAAELKSTFQEMFEKRKEPVEIDFQNLEYIDSTGLGVLIGALKRLKEEDKQITLFHVKPNILKLLNITGLNKIFVIKE
ncbi:STAS domain-containing protein [Isachenkonia alkalipeptolytica]|uniref:Anti-sigma factor antagonist n=1 Tax=Isachenkonia alkalipeptolytica TaxID=2565777 RepID=A0AA44BEG1_9CLOT|nr:STAS domain-containing protein [Isachenkonia alkalipeptolytica]NBG89234.1 STAS domain-containing protein [Isachenkonia alkalipeptolytica]